MTDPLRADTNTLKLSFSNQICFCECDFHIISTQQSGSFQEYLIHTHLSQEDNLNLTIHQKKKKKNTITRNLSMTY